ncbi:MFS transporter [bacterium]|nr:MFS transporter [candidate division CSSED10-310 bacterium]
MPVAIPKLTIRHTFRALRFPNYRLWFQGQLASLIGTFMQATAQGFLVFEMTRSPAYLGYVGFANGVPSWIFMLYGGVISDRMPRRTLLMATQAYMMTLAIITATLTLTGVIQPWHVIVMAFLLGIGHAFDAPARHAFVYELVPREHLANAIAMNSTLFNMATMLGPALGGVLYTIIGPGGCFALNAISYLAVMIALKKMTLPVVKPPARTVSAMKAIGEGLRYIRSEPVILSLIGITWIVSFFCMSYLTLIPAWAVNVIGGNAETNGWLQSARGAGALLGALIIASLNPTASRGICISGALIAVPCLLILFASTGWLPLALITLLGTGLGIITIFNLVNASIQDRVDDAFRGRVMSVYSLVFFGSLPIGALLTGAVAEWAGEPIAIMSNAAVALIFGLVLWFMKPDLRR